MWFRACCHSSKSPWGWGHCVAYKGQVHVLVSCFSRKIVILTAHNHVVMYIGGTRHRVSNCLLMCGMGFGRDMWYRSPNGLQSVFFFLCIFRIFVLEGRCVTPLWTMGNRSP